MENLQGKIKFQLADGPSTIDPHEFVRSHDEPSRQSLHMCTFGIPECA